MKGTTRTFVIALAMATILATVATGAAVAGKGGKGRGHHNSTATGSISLVLLDGATEPHYGARVTFNVSTTATAQPWVNLKCHQNGVLVGEGWEGFFEGSLDDRIFRLASPQWTGGPADCTAYLTTPQWTVLASTSFHVDA